MITAPAPPNPALPSGTGIDAQGDGDMSIALMQFFPDPQPDLSRLPHGSRGDVVLEAVIDAGGHIAQLVVKQGLGYGVDETVVATVEHWTFQPAMRDGKAGREPAGVPLPLRAWVAAHGAGKLTRVGAKPAEHEESTGKHGTE